MFRTVIGLALLLLAPAAAQAQVGGEIAYSIGRDIYLMDPDGSGKRHVYRGAPRTVIFSISMMKGGGQMSFEEAGARTPVGRLKTIAYGATGLGTVIRDVGSGQMYERFNVDMAPDGSVLYTNTLTGDLTYDAAGAAGPVDLDVGGSVSKVAWLPDGTFLFAGYKSGIAGIWRASLANPAGEMVVEVDCVATLNAAHGAGTAEALVRLGNACSDGELMRLDVAAKTLSSGSLADAESPAYSGDDDCFIYIVPGARGRTQLKIQELGGSTSVSVGERADYRSVDWRGDSSPTPCPVAAAPAAAFDFRTP